MLRVLSVWREHRAQQQKRLLERFKQADENGDGVLSLEEFSECLRSLAAASSASPSGDREMDGEAGPISLGERCTKQTNLHGEVLKSSLFYAGVIEAMLRQ